MPWSVMEGRILTLKQVRREPGGQSLLVFSIEGSYRIVQLTWATEAAPLPYLYPLTEDATLRRLKTKFEGRRVWWYGGAVTSLRCPGGGPAESVTIRTGVPTSYLIHRLVRISSVGFQLAMRGGETALDWSKSAFAATDPLVAQLRAPRDLKVTGWTTSGKKRLNLQECTAFQVIFADDWHIERALSLAHPRTLYPTWPRAILNAVLAGDLCKGMSPDMVAWSRGWPDDPGTFEEMRRWAAWRYDSGPPFDDWVYFRNGRVIEWRFPMINSPANTGAKRMCAS